MPRARLCTTRRSNATGAGNRLLSSSYGWVVCCVVLLVVETIGRGVVVVVCSVELLRVTAGGDPAQPASTAVPAIIATPTARLKRDVVLVIV
jgi:hypothetical protein